MTYRVKRLFLDSQEVKYFGTFQTEGEAKMRLAQVLEEAFDELEIDSSEVRGQIEVAMRNGYYHIFIYVPEPSALEDDEILAAREAERAEREAEGDSKASRRKNPPPSKADPGLAMPRKHGVEIERGRPEIVERILKLLESGPLRSSAIRKAVGICSGIHLSRYYLTPMMEKGLIKRTDPDHPQSPQQRYRLA